MDGSGDESPIGDAKAQEALRSRARRIHIYAAISGLVYAGWEWVRWAV